MSILTSLLTSLLQQPWRRSRSRRVPHLLEQACTLLERGEQSSALRYCEQALAAEPQNAHAHALAGSIHAQRAAYDLAVRHLERSILLGADFSDPYINLGNVHRLRGDLSGAEKCYREALEHDPGAALAHYNLALVLKARGAPEQALEHLQRAQGADAVKAEVVRIRVTTLIELGQREKAAQVAREAVEQDPSCRGAWVALGFAQQKLHQPHEALSSYEQALELGGGDAELFNNYGIVKQNLGLIPEALASYAKALALAPDHALARFHRALAHLLIGNYGEAWPDYEARLLSQEYVRRSSVYPRWDGAAPEIRTILVYGEQGLGDEIMFASCLPDLIKTARHCVIECSPRLRALFARAFPGASVNASDSGSPPEAPSIDVEVPIGSLPLYYRRSLSAFPRHTGYLSAEPHRVAAWSSRLHALGPGLKVGLSWKGGTDKSRPVRSIALERLLPVLQTPDVQFVSLQYTDDAEAEIDAFRSKSGITIQHWTEAIADYEETAALVSALDLTLSVCTAVVHLAGALGSPVWVAVPYSPEWRYGFSGDTMAWYPSARLFRQPAYGAWEPVIATLAAGLRDASASFRVQAR